MTAPYPEPVADQVARVFDRTAKKDRVGAILAAKMAGSLAGQLGVPEKPCPFDDPTQAGAWYWYHKVGRLAVIERRETATNDLFTPEADA